MKPDIIKKIEAELQKPIALESQVVYLLVQLRKLIDLGNDRDDYKVLYFHCDWALHPVLDRKAANAIVKLFDHWQALIEAMSSAVDGQQLPPELVSQDGLSETLRLSNFRSELGEYLKAQGLDSGLADDNNQWTNFLKYYAGVIADCPLKCINRGLQYVNEVVLRIVKVLPEPHAGFGGKQLVVEWSWTSNITGIMSINQQFF